MLTYNHNADDGKDVERLVKAIEDLFFYAARVQGRQAQMTDLQVGEFYGFKAHPADIPDATSGAAGKSECNALCTRLLTVDGGATPVDLLNYLRDFPAKIR
jgi:hypothetical protein